MPSCRNWAKGGLGRLPARGGGAASGLLSGWLVMGAMAGRGYSDAVGIGLTTSVIAGASFTLLGFSTWEMVVDATHGQDTAIRRWRPSPASFRP
jgi:hypothetical protein